MKKIIIVLFAAILLCGCSNGDTAEIVSEKPETQTEQVASDINGEDQFAYHTYTLDDVIEEFGDNYEVVDYEGAQFIVYGENVPYSFGFTYLDPNSRVSSIMLKEGSIFNGVKIGAKISEIVSVLGDPDSKYADEMGEDGYFTEYDYGQYSIAFVSDEEDSSTKYAKVFVHNIADDKGSVEQISSAEMNEYYYDPASIPELRAFNNERKYGFIDREGNVVIEPKFQYVSERDDLGNIFVLEDDKVGMINDDGEVLIDFIYDRIERIFDDAYMVTMDEMEYLISGTGEVIYSGTKGHYSRCGRFYNDVAPIFLGDRDALINKNGEVLTDFKYVVIYDFKEGLARAEYQVKDKYGIDEVSEYVFLDDSGDVVIGPFEYVSEFHEGLASFIEDGKYGYVNTSGITVIQPQYSEVSEFSEGLAAVDSDGNGTYGYINTVGEMVIEEKYYAADIFSNGRAVVKSIGGFPNVIDRYGKCIYNGPEHGVFEIGPFSSGLAVVRKSGGMYDLNGHMGYIDRNGNLAIPFDFDYTGQFYDGIATVSIGEHTFTIDTDGNRVGN